MPNPKLPDDDPLFVDNRKFFFIFYPVSPIIEYHVEVTWISKKFFLNN